MKPLPALTLILLFCAVALLTLSPHACARTELTASLVIEPKNEAPDLHAIRCVAFDGESIVIGVDTGELSSLKDRVLIYDTTGRLAGEIDGSYEGVHVAGGTIFVYDSGFVNAYDTRGNRLYSVTPGRFGITPAGRYNSTESLAFDGEYIYDYEARTGTIRKVTRSNVLVAEYAYSRGGGPLLLRGSEIWASDPKVTGKTIVFDGSLRPLREMAAGFEDMAVYDDRIVTLELDYLVFRDKDLKETNRAYPMPSSWVIDMDVADGKAVAAKMVRTANATATSPAVFDYRVYVYDLAAVEPRGKPLPSPAPEPYVAPEPPAREFVKTYSAQGGVSIASVTGVEDGYILAGSVNTPGGTKAYVVKTGLDGSPAWVRTLEKYPNSQALSIEALPDDGCLIVGNARNAAGDGEDSIAARLGPDGVVAWESRFEAPGDDRLYDVALAADGSFVAAGQQSGPSGAYTQLYVARISADGNLLSAKTYGNTSSEDYKAGRAVTRTSDGNFVIAGAANHLYNQYTSNYTCLAKVSPDGSLLWERYLNVGQPASFGSDVVETTDGGLAIAGNAMLPAGSGSFTAGKSSYTINYDALLIKTDRNGEIEWCRTYDGVYREGNSNNDANALRETADGGFLLAGKTMSPSADGKQIWINTACVPMIVKTDARGLVLWKMYAGDNGAVEGRAAFVDTGGAYLIAGDGTDGGLPAGFLLKLKAEKLAPTTIATPAPSGTAVPATPAPVSQSGTGGSCCPMAVLPLLLVGSAMIARSRLRRDNGRQ
ncbi:MAG: hypothetical protein A4E28_00481 [Methanocella sp. PtaU1.Bin125]|nr:MAG: hypothetical protein A4E28_00481 [Methanocella sp. PtaU1.Bin125]